MGAQLATLTQGDSEENKEALRRWTEKQKCKKKGIPYVDSNPPKKERAGHDVRGHSDDSENVRGRDGENGRGRGDRGHDGRERRGPRPEHGRAPREELSEKDRRIQELEAQVRELKKTRIAPRGGVKDVEPRSNDGRDFIRGDPYRDQRREYEENFRPQRPRGHPRNDDGMNSSRSYGPKSDRDVYDNPMRSSGPRNDQRIYDSYDRLLSGRERTGGSGYDYNPRLEQTRSVRNVRPVDDYRREPQDYNRPRQRRQI